MTRLRAATPADADAIAVVFTASRALLSFLPPLHTAEEDRAFIAGHVLNTCTVTVALDGDDTIAGFLAESPGWVEHLYLRPDMRGRGLGGVLLAATKARQPSLQLWCFAHNNAARAFYARHGFVEVEVTDGSRNESREPDVRLEWRRG